MGLVDALSAEDRVDVKFSDFFRMAKAVAEVALLKNAIYAEVPYEEVRKMLTGKNSELEEFRQLGLTPDEWREVDRLYTELCEEKAELLKKVELLKLEKDGATQRLEKIKESWNSDDTGISGEGKTDAGAGAAGG